MVDYQCALLCCFFGFCLFSSVSVDSLFTCNSYCEEGPEEEERRDHGQTICMRDDDSEGEGQEISAHMDCRTDKKARKLIWYIPECGVPCGDELTTAAPGRWVNPLDRRQSALCSRRSLDRSHVEEWPWPEREREKETRQEEENEEGGGEREYKEKRA